MSYPQSPPATLTAEEKKLIAKSSIHAAMEAIRNFSDPDVISCSRPKIPKEGGKTVEINKKIQWLYDRLMVIHRFAKEALDRDDKEIGLLEVIPTSSYEGRSSDESH